MKITTLSSSLYLYINSRHIVDLITQVGPDEEHIHSRYRVVLFSFINFPDLTLYITRSHCSPPLPDPIAPFPNPSPIDSNQRLCVQTHHIPSPS